MVNYGVYENGLATTGTPFGSIETKPEILSILESAYSLKSAINLSILALVGITLY